MKASKDRNSGRAAPDYYQNEGAARVFSTTLTVETGERLDLINLTDEVRALAESSGIKDGFIQISSLHTTAALMVNEWQEALLSDIKAMLERMVPRDSYYKHNDPEFSDCDRHNADSHLRNVVLGLSLSIPISQGQPVLGRWQSVILAEFDGPNQRKVFLQAFGV
jgi:secondary thiamine-phosphate synthase enzyme